MEPQQINVIIYAARNLQPKGGHDLCKPLVIFGIGKEKFRTECANGSNPTWNEESSIEVTKSAPLVFTVTDREVVLGTVTVPLAQIPSAAHKRRWMSLTKKTAAVGGDLCFDCWVTSYHKQSEGGTKWGLTTTGITTDRTKRRFSVEQSCTSLKGSRSLENLSSTSNVIGNITLGLLKLGHSGIPETEKEGCKTGAQDKLLQSPSWLQSGKDDRTGNSAVSAGGVPEIRQTLSSPILDTHPVPASGQVDLQAKVPDITGISPKFGPASGGTRIILRGRNFGNRLAEVVSLSLCGCDLLNTVEYHSPTKLICVTRPWNGCGPVVLVTKSGGRGSSTAMFSFKNDLNEQGTAKHEYRDDAKKDGKGKVARSELLNEITRLRQKVHDLSADNERLKKYIDRVVLTVMEKFPNILENLTTTL